MNDKPRAYRPVPDDGKINPRIAAQFDTPYKLDKALDRLIDEAEQDNEAQGAD